MAQRRSKYVDELVGKAGELGNTDLKLLRQTAEALSVRPIESRRQLRELLVLLRRLRVDRSVPVSLIGPDCSIVEQDPRSLALNELDPGRLLFRDFFQPGELSISGETKYDRLKNVPDLIRLDSAWGPVLLDEPGQQTLNELSDRGVKEFDLPGTIFQDSNLGLRFFLSLYRPNQWRGIFYGPWSHRRRNLIGERTVQRPCPSMLLAAD